ncbi:MAG TPA: DUF6766 family protein [Acidobacteriaceae bacterium]|nr:DUF6766 family protein [Acidobacteriaceae bacterium]
MKKLKKFIADNSLLLVFIFLFLGFLAGQVFSGAAAYNDTRAVHGLPGIGYWCYVATGNFLQGVFANWQAAILQLGSLILFSVFLRARGAAHSIDPDKPREKTRSRWSLGRSRTRASGKTASWLYRNSLSIAFTVLFFAAFILHLLSGAAAYNEQLALSHRPPLSVAAFFVSSQFWFSTLQTWEAEYMAIALYIFLTIFLRQEGSPESKPVEAKDSDTGKANK